MELQRVLTILDDVAAGHANAEVSEALQTASTLLKRRPAAAGARWTDEEDARLARAFDEGRGLPELARAHGRSRGAIAARLVKLGRMTAEEAGVRMR